MAPRVLEGVGGAVANEVVKKVVDYSFKKFPGQGKRLGGNRRGKKRVQDGIMRAIGFGLGKTESSGGFRNLLNGGLSQVKREGFAHVAKKVLNFASSGLVKMVNPSGFAVVFKDTPTLAGSISLVPFDPSISGVSTSTRESDVARETDNEETTCQTNSPEGQSVLKTAKSEF